jgi:hypothetical protein
MKLFQTAKARHAAAIMEEMFYGMAAEELASNKPSTGLYAKAQIEAEGDAVKTRVAYIKLRVRALQIENAALHENKSKQPAAMQVVAQALAERKAAITSKESEDARKPITNLILFFVGFPGLIWTIGELFPDIKPLLVIIFSSWKS